MTESLYTGRPLETAASLEDGDFDLLAVLGVVLPGPTLPKSLAAGERPPRAKPKRFTDWRDGPSGSFVDEGYAARVTQVTCETCGGLSEVFEGVFHVERHSSGTRRMQALGRGVQWPAGTEWPLELTQAFTLLCGGCVRGLGFSRERETDGEPFALVVRTPAGPAGPANKGSA